MATGPFFLSQKNSMFVLFIVCTYYVPSPVPGIWRLSENRHSPWWGDNDTDKDVTQAQVMGSEGLHP